LKERKTGSPTSWLTPEHGRATCHGNNLEGGLGGELRSGNWKHGGEPEDLFRSIKEGYPELAMPAFGDTLTDAQIRALVVFIRERVHQTKAERRDEPKPVDSKPVSTRYHRYRVEPFVEEGLDTPWAIAFLPDGRALVTERPGRLRIVEDGQLLPDPVTDTPDTWEHSQGGYMEVALHPEYADNGWIYLAYTDRIGNEELAYTKIVRGRLEDNRWIDQEVIFEVPEKFYSGRGHHFGIRFAFEDGYLFFTIGDRGQQNLAQDLGNPSGKTHRIYDDGRVPEDNPFADNPEAYPTVWTYGNRNPQGLAFHPATGELWSTEHGPRGGDELNLIRPGLNYGWPVVTYGINYNGTPISDLTEAPGMEPPVLHWTPSIAVCGIDFYTGESFPQWQNDLFVTGLRSQELWRYRLVDGQVAEEELILKDIGRVRDVHTGPDGALYLLLHQPERIVRLVPAG
ncbi:MAG: PQQ-dependent sugar dehydrogenase, partial [Verrucomicrobiota bacterium]